MATIHLNANATSFASPNWGGAGIADTNDLVIEYPFGVVALGLDQSGLATGVNSLWIKPGATAGQIGGNGAGSFIATIIAFYANYGNVTAFITAGGPSNTCAAVDQASGTTNLTGGTFTNVYASGGTLNANASSVITNFAAYGGSGEIAYNATPITTAEIYGGVWIIRRAVTNLYIAQNALVYYDPDDAATITGTAITTYGGRLIHIAGATPTIRNRGGTHDFSQARRSFTPGATAWTFFGTKFRDSASVVTTNRVAVTGSKQVADSVPL